MFMSRISNDGTQLLGYKTQPKVDLFWPKYRLKLTPLSITYGTFIADCGMSKYIVKIK